MLVVAAAVLTLLGGSRAEAGNCSNRSLKGDYGFTISGLAGQVPSSLAPLAGLALTHFDGRGNLSQKDFVVANGVATSTDFVGDETGTYSVNGDCTGSATINFPDGRQLNLKLVVVNRGREVRVVVASLTQGGMTLPVTTLSNGVRVD
jgi:hypothetical protein